MTHHSLTADHTRARAAITWNIAPFIGGEYQSSSASDSVKDIDPSTEEALCVAPVGNQADVDEAVRVARRTFRRGSWSELPPSRRGEVLLRLADLLVEHAGEIALLDCLEMGKPIQSARYDATELAPAYLRAAAGFADRLVGTTAPLSETTLSFNTWEPRGVVGAITAWNYPVVNAAVKIGPVLAAGNTLVLKPSELAPSSALKLAELALEAGLPEGVLNVVPGLGYTVGEALASHPDVDMVSFTGSTATGRRVMELAARSNGKPLLLECGGKSPTVVFDDVEDFDAVADGAIETVLWNSGQVCSAYTRLIIHGGVKDSLLQKVVERASRVRFGDPLDETTTFGPLASPIQRDRVKRYIEGALDAGARALLLGAVQESGGCYVAPTVFDRVDHDMAIAQEEIFGPVLCVQEFTTEEEAIALANATDYGLAAAVWTRDLGRGRRMAHAIRAGGVWVRTGGTEDAGTGVALSYEPQSASGFGAEKGPRSLESYSTLKTIDFTGA